MALNAKQREALLANVIAHTMESPFLWSIFDILNFKAPNGDTVTNFIKKEEIIEFITAKLVPPNDIEMPVLLKYHIEDGNKDVYAHKERVMQLCDQLITQQRPLIREYIVRRWTELFRNYDQDEAMKSNQDFERFVASLVSKTAPALAAVVRDKRTAVIQEDMAKALGNSSKTIRVFEDWQPVAYRELFALNREDLLYSSKRTLSFWYTNPLFVFIVRFFAGKNKQRAKQARKGAANPAKKGTVQAAKTPVVTPAAALVEELIGDKNIDICLANYADRWNTKLDKRARQRFQEDIDAVIRDSVRYVLRLQQRSQINARTLDESAQTIITHNESMQAIADKDTLRQYIKLFIAKLLLSGKYNR
jgi:hypothetical protein